MMLSEMERTLTNKRDFLQTLEIRRFCMGRRRFAIQARSSSFPYKSLWFRKFSSCHKIFTFRFKSLWKEKKWKHHTKLRGVYMMPGRLSYPREFTPVPSCCSVFVDKIPSRLENVIPLRVISTWVQPVSWSGARISSRCDISQRPIM